LSLSELFGVELSRYLVLGLAVAPVRVGFFQITAQGDAACIRRVPIASPPMIGRSVHPLAHSYPLPCRQIWSPSDNPRAPRKHGKSSGIVAPWWSTTHLQPEFDSHGAGSRISVQICANLLSHCHPWIGLQPAAVPGGQSCCGSHSHPAGNCAARSGADLGPHCGAGGTQTSSLLCSRCVPFGQSDSSRNIPVGQNSPSRHSQ